MRLFGIYTGTLSADIAPPAKFDGWNTIIGEGSAPEAAEDMLVTVKIRGTKEGEGMPPLFIEAHDGKGKLIASRKAQPFLLDTRGHANFGLWLRGIGCAGRLSVIARMGKAVQRSFVNLDCGE